MNRFLVLSLAAIGGTAALATSTSAAEGDAGSVYVSPMLQYSLQDNDPELKDNFGYQLGLGINLPHEWALEGDFSRGQFDIKRFDAQRRLTGGSIDVIKKFLPENIMQRYMLSGGAPWMSCCTG